MTYLHTERTIYKIILSDVHENEIKDKYSKPWKFHYVPYQCQKRPVFTLHHVWLRYCDDDCVRQLSMLTNILKSLSNAEMNLQGSANDGKRAFKGLVQRRNELTRARQ